MGFITKHSYKFITFFIFALAATLPVAGQQNARLNFGKLERLEKKALEVVEVNIDGKMLDLAKRVLAKSSDKDSKVVAEAIKNLQAIYVRVYNFEKENEYDVADVDEVRSQLQSPGWEMLANVRSKKKGEKVDVYTMFTGQNMSGVAVVVSDIKSIALINVIGEIDIDTLVELTGKMNIPKIDIEKEKDKEKDKIKDQ